MQKLEFNNLSYELIKRGESKKGLIGEIGKYRVEVLKLEPFAEVKKHKHYDDWEVMVDLSLPIIPLQTTSCKVGESHEPQNPTNVVKKFLCIKAKKEKELPQYISDKNRIELDSFIVEFKKGKEFFSETKNSIEMNWEIVYCVETDEIAFYQHKDSKTKHERWDRESPYLHFICIKLKNCQK